MKQIHKIFSLFLLLAIVVSLAACGNKQDASTPKQTECNHNEVIDSAVPASCTQSGLSEGKHCSLCNEVLVKQEELPATGHTEEIIAAIDATCTAAGNTEGKKCSVCREVLVATEHIPSLGHTTTTGTCTRCNKCFGIFRTGYYVDEFQQPTSEGYVSNSSYIEGTFSNSATTNSKLYVQVLADDEDVAFFLYEYGNNQVKNYSSYSTDDYDITMKTADGTKHTLKGTVYCGGDRLFINSKYISTVLNALKSGEKVSFYIVNSDYTLSTYLFTIETSNFAEEYAKLFS